jgi:hypothetical protein
MNTDNEFHWFDILPDIPLMHIFQYLSAKDVARISATCATLQYHASRDLIWKQFCLLDWPWFFYLGTCEATLMPLVKRKSRPQNQGNSSPPMVLFDNDGAPILNVFAAVNQHFLHFEYTAVCDGDLGKRCSCPHTYKDNPFQPLLEVPIVASPKSPTTRKHIYPYKNAYYKIANGEFSGLIQVINSLNERPLSAYTAVATFDHASEVFHLSYHPKLISLYRRGSPIILHPNSEHSSFIEESISLSERHRLRRIPDDLLDFDPREFYSRELFLTEHNPGNPSFKEGDEVEVQWRMTSSQCWAWWRVSVFLTHRISFGY